MSATLDRKLRAASGRLSAGDLAGVERLCGEILKKAPRHPGALHLLGMTRLAGGNAREAAVLIHQALEHDPDNSLLLENLGFARLVAGDSAGAEPLFRRALRLGALRASLHMRLGLALLSQKRPAEAVTALRAAAEKAPDDPDVQLNLGNALAETGAMDEALGCYRKADALRPGRPDAYFNIGTLLMRMGRLADAESAYRAALTADPRSADVRHNLGLLFQQQGRAEEAVESYRQALALNPHRVQARNNLGNLMRAQARFDEAVDCYAQAIADDPAYLDAHVNLGIARAEQGRYAEALVQYERALALEPGFADAQYNLGVARLYRHEFESGWAGYEKRLDYVLIRAGIRRESATLDLYESLPRWRGPGESGVEEVAIWGEQGIGDQVLFSTLIPELIAAGVSFTYEVDRRLLGAYERAFPGARFVALQDPPQAALRQASRVLLAGSLPGLFRCSRADFARQPQKLFSALPGRVAHYRERLAQAGPGLKVALSWKSTRKDYLGPRKSAALMEFVPLLKQAGAHFVDVQYGDTAAERAAVEKSAGVRLLRFDEVDYTNDLEELLAILGSCDLLITTSNATAHLAGALGQRTWLLYPADNPPFHYWSHGGSGRSLWYPSVEIVTSPQLEQWPSLIRYAAAKLSAESAGAQARPSL